MLLFEETDFFIQVFEGIKNFFVGDGWKKMVIALAVAVIGGLLVTFVCWLVRKILYRTSIDVAAVTFVSALLTVVLWIFLIFGIADIVGISTSSLLVAFSSVALAVGLALKDSLANLANGILIIANKPFKRGDHVQINGLEGIVQNIKLMTIELISFDNKLLILPNSAVTTNNVINFSALPTRRLQWSFFVSSKTDLDLVESILKDLLNSQEKVLKTPAPTIYMTEQSLDGSVTFTVRAWSNTEDYWGINFRLPRLVYDTFKANNIIVPFKQLDVNFLTKGEEQVLAPKGKKSNKKKFLPKIKDNANDDTVEDAAKDV